MASLLRLIQHNPGDESGISLQTVCDDVGGPVNLKTDRASCFEGRDTPFKEVVHKDRIKLSHAEAGRHNEL